MLKRFILIFVLITSLTAPLPAVYAQRSSRATTVATAPSSSLATSRKLADQITEAQLKDYLYFIASDEMEGRDTPSRGLDTVAKFIAMNLSRWGFKPAGDDGTFFQRIALKRNPAQTGRPFLFDLSQRYDAAKMSGPDYVI